MQRFALHFAFAYNMSKNGCATPSRTGGNPRAWTSVPGRFPSFLPYGDYMRQRVAAPENRHLTANQAVPLTYVG